MNWKNLKMSFESSVSQSCEVIFRGFVSLEVSFNITVQIFLKFLTIFFELFEKKIVLKEKLVFSKFLFKFLQNVTKPPKQPQHQSFSFRAIFHSEPFRFHSSADSIFFALFVKCAFVEFHVLLNIFIVFVWQRISLIDRYEFLSFFNAFYFYRMIFHLKTFDLKGL